MAKKPNTQIIPFKGIFGDIDKDELKRELDELAKINKNKPKTVTH